MEAVARQFATNEHVMVLRNGQFSYRWSQIFEWGGIPKSETVLKARPINNNSTVSSNDGFSVIPVIHAQYRPYLIHKVVERIRQEQPTVFFAPHVETSTGIILPDAYMDQIAQAVHRHDGLFVLDAIASGSMWVDMKERGVDVLISAPQKGWTAQPCAALVLFSARALRRMNPIHDTSFSLSLTRWTAVMEAYEHGDYAYHTTPPTDALRVFQQVSVEMLEFGLPELKQAQTVMGARARQMLQDKGLVSVAAPNYQAPGVLVFYSPEQKVSNDTRSMVELFQEHGLQIAKGVPWMLDEPEGIQTFRLGMFGLDKLERLEQTLRILGEALDHVLADTE